MFPSNRLHTDEIRPLNTSPPPTSEPVVPESNHRETVADFVRWAVAQLELEWEERDGIGRLQLPEADQAIFSGQSELQVSLQEGTADGQQETLDLDGRFSQWLLNRLQGVGPAMHVRPSKQPMAVNDISERLFAAYEVEDGRVHLGGCQLTDYPFLRLSFVARTKNGSEEIRHLFVAHDGSSVSDELARELGLVQVRPIVKLPPRIDDAALQALIAAGRRVAAKTVASRDPSATSIEPIAISLVWVKQASGQLNFTIGETTVGLPFSGWARLIQAKPYTSPLSGASSFHLAATDDGRIDAFDQMATCEQSGRRVLRQDLVTCGVTGKHVLEEFTEICSVSGKPSLTEQFAICPVCQQRVSKAVLENEACTACRSLTKIKKEDPRLVWILGEHGGLNRWNHWQLSETQTVYIAMASRWTQRLRVVVDKETLAVQHLATSGKFGSVWVPVAEAAWNELLG